MRIQSADRGDLSSRRLRYAVAASLLLHLLLLWPAALPQRQEADVPGSLHATMRPVTPPVTPQAPKPAPVAVAPAPTSIREVRTPAQAVPESPQALPVPLATTAPANPLVRTVGVSPASEASGASSSSGVAAAPVPAVTPGTRLSAEGLRGYRLAVATQARRFKRYPPEAMSAGWEGSAEIRLEVGSDGLPRPALVTRGSGHEALDRAALAMIDAGAARARLPDSLRGQGFSIVLPVVFKLDEQ